MIQRSFIYILITTPFLFANILLLLPCLYYFHFSTDSKLLKCNRVYFFFLTSSWTSFSSSSWASFSSSIWTCWSSDYFSSSSSISIGGTSLFFSSSASSFSSISIWGCSPFDFPLLLILRLYPFAAVLHFLPVVLLLRLRIYLLREILTRRMMRNSLMVFFCICLYILCFWTNEPVGNSIHKNNDYRLLYHICSSLNERCLACYEMTWWR